MDILSGLNQAILHTLQHNFSWFVLAKVLLEFFIIAYAVVWLYRRIKGTQAERLVKGLLILSSICILSWLAGFTLITRILQQLIPVAALGVIIIFQPEIRRGLGYLGRAKTFAIDLSLIDSQKYKWNMVIEEIISAVRELSRGKIGALIVVEPPEGERDYLSPGTALNADISSNLLLSIYNPTSPLHDGAVVIRKDKIILAGVILHTITENQQLSSRYGTRHRAAIGLSEIYDGLCIVVSEETGSISCANRGMLVRYANADELHDPLSYLYEQGSVTGASNPLSHFLNMFSKSKRESDTTGGDTDGGNLSPPAKSSQESEDKESSSAGV